MRKGGNAFILIYILYTTSGRVTPTHTVVMRVPHNDALLVERGLTAREAMGVRVRYRRLHKDAHFDLALQRTLLDLDALDLERGQAAHLLRSFDIPALGVDCRRAAAREPDAPRWCSYKKALCDCAALTHQGTSADGGAADAAPRFLAIDCEFKPLRLAAVDERGRVRIDAIVLPALAPAGTSQNALPGILACDRLTLHRAPLPQLQDQLLRWAAAGTVLVGHTVRGDLRALGLDPLPPRVRVVDVAETVQGRTGRESVSLQRMAATHLNGLSIHRGGRKHCATQDALVAMNLFAKLNPAATPITPPLQQRDEDGRYCDGAL